MQVARHSCVSWFTSTAAVAEKKNTHTHRTSKQQTAEQMTEDEREREQNIKKKISNISLVTRKSRYAHVFNYM